MVRGIFNDALRLIDARFLRFLLTGMMNTAVGYGLYLMCLFVAGNAVLAMTCSTILSVTFNFFSLGRIVFKSSDHRVIWKFLAVYGVIYVYNAIGLIALENAGVHPAIAGLLILPGAVTISWLLNSRFVFAGIGGNASVSLTSR